MSHVFTLHHGHATHEGCQILICKPVCWDGVPPSHKDAPAWICPTTSSLNYHRELSRGQPWPTAPGAGGGWTTIFIVVLLNVEGNVTSQGDPVPNCIEIFEDKMAEVNIDMIEAHEAGALAEGTGFMYTGIPLSFVYFNFNNVVGTAGLS